MYTINDPSRISKSRIKTQTTDSAVIVQGKENRKLPKQLLLPMITNRRYDYSVKKSYGKRSAIGKSISFCPESFMEPLNKAVVNLHKKQSQYNSRVPISRIKTYLYPIKKQSGYIQQLAWNSYQGTKQFNQDRVSIHMYFEYDSKTYNFYGIFDGHGGSITSEFLYNNMFRTFQKYMKQNQSVSDALKKSLKQIQNKMINMYTIHKKDKSGSCALICVIQGENLYFANIGDSRAIFVEKKQIKQITNDHKPENQRSRIQATGCKVVRMKAQDDTPIGPYRIWPFKISVSRTIGDIMAKTSQNGSGISSQPDIFYETIPLGISTLILMSDGAYETMSNEQIGSMFSSHPVNQSIDKLILNSIVKGSSDNLSLIAIKFSR